MTRTARGTRHIAAQLLGTRFRFDTGGGLFSAERIDDGTRLLLDHLPARAPSSVLDLGCGYGALGLPVAARWPEARCLLVDRLVSAVEATRRNAESNGLSRVEARASLGYRDIPPDLRFDWILCNVPARIGDAAIASFVAEGARRLTADGELRIVVINDLAPAVEQIARDQRRPFRVAGEGARHRVFAFAPPALSDAPPEESETIYARDTVTLGERRFERPQDISEDPDHLDEGLPLLLEVLPRRTSGPSLVWRGGYGAAAITLATRGVSVVAADVDLLATTYTRRNAAHLGVSLETREAGTLAGALRDREAYPLLIGDLAPSLDDEGGREELATAVAALAPGGQAIWLARSSKARILEAAGGVAVARRAVFSTWRFAAQRKRS